MTKSGIFDGRLFAKNKEEKLVRVIRNIGRTPKLTAILVGDNPESSLYLKLKEKKALQLGIGCTIKKFSGEESGEIIDFIQSENNNLATNGIILELPFPPKIRNEEQKILDSIAFKKDVDCLTSENLARLTQENELFVPPTVQAVLDILKEAEQVSDLADLKGQKIVVVGDRGMVGKPLVKILVSCGLAVSGANTSTQDLTKMTKQADILISTTGVGGLIKNAMVKTGVVVIDVGIEKQKDGRIAGDVDFENVKQKASFITPVPGGVGPVTVVCLMENLVASMYD